MDTFANAEPDRDTRCFLVNVAGLLLLGQKTVTIHEAKTNLSRPIEGACAGEEIIFARGSEAVARCGYPRAGQDSRCDARGAGSTSW
jgi:hypothetical protein